MSRLAAFTQSHRWIWSLAAIVVLWLILGGVTDRFSIHSLSGVATSAAFLTFAALGQMFVVTTGRGNIDLSIASVITLTAFVTAIISAGNDARLPLALAAALGVGLLAGAANAFLVVVLRIPAMIATLAMGYVLATGTLMVNRQVTSFSASPSLSYIASGKIGGFPVVMLAAVLFCAFAAFVLHRTVYGRMLSAVGQNLRAAELAGVPTRFVVAAAFIISGGLAALAGALLSGYVGGAFLDLGAPYLLQSVGAVVLGGSLIAGGSSTAAGTLFGSVLLILIVTTMQVAGLPPGTQDIVQGGVIILVLALAGGAALPRRGRSQKRKSRKGAVLQG